MAVRMLTARRVTKCHDPCITVARKKAAKHSAGSGLIAGNKCRKGCGGAARLRRPWPHPITTQSSCPSSLSSLHRRHPPSSFSLVTPYPLYRSHRPHPLSALSALALVALIVQCVAGMGRDMLMHGGTPSFPLIVLPRRPHCPHLLPSSPLIALIPLVPLIPLIALIPPRPHLP